MTYQCPPPVWRLRQNFHSVLVLVHVLLLVAVAVFVNAPVRVPVKEYVGVDPGVMVGVSAEELSVVEIVRPGESLGVLVLPVADEVGLPEGVAVLMEGLCVREWGQLLLGVRPLPEEVLLAVLRVSESVWLSVGAVNEFEVLCVADVVEDLLGVFLLRDLELVRIDDVPVDDLLADFGLPEVV